MPKKTPEIPWTMIMLGLGVILYFEWQAKAARQAADSAAQLAASTYNPPTE